LVVVSAAVNTLGGCGSSLDGTVALDAEGRTATVTFDEFPALIVPGGSVVVGIEARFPIVVVRTTDDAAVALSATCTHEGCLLAYAPSKQTLACPCHDADFSLQGDVIHGPPRFPVPRYDARLTASGIVVDIESA